MIILTYIGIGLKILGYAIALIPMSVKAFFEWRDVKRKFEAAVQEKSAGGKQITPEELEGIVIELSQAVGASSNVVEKLKEAFTSFKTG